MRQIFGDFVEQKNSKEYLIIHFSPTSLPLQQRWRNTGLSADFLAEYWATFFPAHDVPSRNRQQEITGAINYIANELLENVMKFGYLPTNYPVTLELYLYQDEFNFYASNVIDPQSIEDFQARIQTLLTKDPLELYLQQIERNAASDSTTSQLGLLTIINDYDTHLAWKFEPSSQEPEMIILTTMVQLTL